LDFTFSAWNAIVAPRGIAPEVTSALQEALSRALDDPQIVSKLAALGSTVPLVAERGPDALARLIASEVIRIKSSVGADPNGK
jgi:tripartite-type tricarboxylate transporter receptor subunit TctC